ncbi:MAG: hypothetical protein RR177_00865 [Oscillospiraceae bacterium]
MKYLFIGAGNGIYTYEFLKQICDSGLDITIYDMAPMMKEIPEFQEFYRSKNIKIVKKKIFPDRWQSLLKNRKLINSLGKFDIVNIHFLATEETLLLSTLSKNYRRIIASFYGSDMLRVKKINKILQKPFLNKSTDITVSTDNMYKYAGEFFSKKNLQKVSQIGFGTSSIDNLLDIRKTKTKSECKMMFGFPEDKLAVFCGYNRSRAHRQIDIIKMLGKLSQEIKDKIYIVCHCSYPQNDEEYLDEISRGIAESGCEGRVLTDYLVGERLMYLRLSTDIMFNVQSTDACSASMSESIMSNAVVIIGDWLSYPAYEKEQVYLQTIHEFSDITPLVEDIVLNYNDYYEKTRDNPEKVYRAFSWELNSGPKWRNLIFDKHKNEKYKCENFS